MLLGIALNIERHGQLWLLLLAGGKFQRLELALSAPKPTSFTHTSANLHVLHVLHTSANLHVLQDYKMLRPLRAAAVMISEDKCSTGLIRRLDNNWLAPWQQPTSHPMLSVLYFVFLYFCTFDLHWKQLIELPDSSPPPSLCWVYFVGLLCFTAAQARKSTMAAILPLNVNWHCFPLFDVRWEIQSFGGI